MAKTLIPYPIHIPKNGGGSMWRRLNLKKPIGHRRLTELPDLNPDTVFIFGFLRCPLDRAVSLYHFFKQSPDIDFKAGPNRRGLWATHIFLKSFDLDINDFWHNVTPEIFGPCYLMRRQRYWVQGPYAEHFNAFDFAKFDSEMELICKRLNVVERKGVPPVHKTKRGGLEELDKKAKRRIKKIYRADFRLLDRYGIPHNG